MQCVRSTISPAYIIGWKQKCPFTVWLREKGQMVSDTLIFIPFPFVIPFQITPFLLQASSCSSASSYFLTHPWQYAYSHPLAHIVLSEPLTTSSSISRLSLKNISSVPWNGPYHPHSRNPTESVLETTQSSIEGDGAPDRRHYLDRDINVIQGGEKKCKLEKEIMSNSVSVWQPFWGPMAGDVSLPVPMLISMLSSMLNLAGSEDCYYLPVSHTGSQNTDETNKSSWSRDLISR